MRNFKFNGEVYAYDETDPEQRPFMEEKIALGAEELAPGTWPPLPSVEECLALYGVTIQNALDSGAASWGYDTLVSAASYAASRNKRFKAEAVALIAWRDDVWTWLENESAEIRDGKKPVSSKEEIVIKMPKQPERPA